MKSVCIWSYSGPHFATFRLNTERYSVSLCIQCKCGKLCQNNSEYGYYLWSVKFKSKIKITGKTPADCNTKNVEIVVSLKYFSNFWRTLEMPLINCEIGLIIT